MTRNRNESNESNPAHDANRSAVSKMNSDTETLVDGANGENMQAREAGNMSPFTRHMTQIEMG